MFEIGEEIICIDDSVKIEKFISAINIFQNWIQKDKSYIVRDILYNDDIVTGILLKGVHNKPIFIELLNRVQEPAFATWRFRKREIADIDESFEENEMLKRKTEVELIEVLQ